MLTSLSAALVGALVGGLVVALVLTKRHAATAAEAAGLRVRVEAAETSAADARRQAAETESRLRETFTALSRDALKDNRTDFLQNASALLTPMREALERVQVHLHDVDKAREGTWRAVSTQLGSLASAQEQLRQAAEGLTRSLQSPNVRGRWGEVQLRRIVELAGLVQHCDFIEKTTVAGDDGARQTPDLIVTLPGDTTIVVDAKVPIDGYLASTKATTDAERKAALALHLRQVRDHVRTLGAKEYWRQFQPAPEFVVMFLPIEPLLAAAFEQDGTLFDQAASLRVIPATPTTLLALLKAVAYGWNQQQLAQNAEEIRTIGRELYDRLAKLVEHLSDVGRNIKQAADSYDRFIGSLERKVLPGARRFKELGVTSTRELEPPDPLHLSLRQVTSEELTLVGERDSGDEDA